MLVLHRLRCCGARPASAARVTRALYKTGGRAASTPARQVFDAVRTVGFAVRLVAAQVEHVAGAEDLDLAAGVDADLALQDQRPGFERVRMVVEAAVGLALDQDRLGVAVGREGVDECLAFHAVRFRPWMMGRV